MVGEMLNNFNNRSAHMPYILSLFSLTATGCDLRLRLKGIKFSGTLDILAFDTPLKLSFKTRRIVNDLILYCDSSYMKLS